ncbi:restriction endonuclease subunit S [Oceanimonas sp. CAM02]|uniref:restriction endonuclease subunit S n=1 Tax=Oceanimonas sp. CAM02 TaxID=3080336 RepID=UPI002936BC55|nr:restriction endonuclease subunit S [Oceanimonas sp. CAM02]MDV2858672.1 restriction endonuclease subunit S [Oceanimonas sp. CAM02]
MNNQVAQVSKKELAAAEPMVPVGYKQTEVGVIPEDWEVCSLGNLSNFITSGSRGWAQFYSNQGALFVRSQNVRNGKLDLKDSQFVTPQVGAEGDRTRLKKYDLLITITGNSVGNVALVEEDLGDAYISQHVGLVRLKYFESAKYICMFLSPGSFGNYQIAASQSGQSKPGLTLKNLNDFLIVTPSLPEEQTAIANALSDVDALIGSLEALIAKKQAIKTATMQQLLTGRTRLPQFANHPDGSSKGYKTSELGEIPEDWEVVKIGDVALVDSENLGSSTALDYEFDYISLEQVDTGTLLNTTKLKFSSAPSRARRILKKGDVLVSTVRPNLMSHYFVSNEVKDLICSTGFSVVRSIEEKMCSGYLYQHLFSSVINGQIEMLISGSNYPSINGRDVNNLKLQIGSLDEQTAIATILSDMDEEIQALETRLTKTRDLKQGMMQQLLTGKIRLVKPLAGDEHHAG